MNTNNGHKSPNPQANKVLYVDDESYHQNWFSSAFKQEFHVEIAGSVDEALEILEERHYEFAVLATDFHMPERNGLELLEIVQKQYRFLIRLLISAYADKTVAIAAVNQGRVFRIIEKPWEVFSVADVLRESLALYRAQAMDRTLREGRVQSMRETIGFLAHELNTPLVTVRGHIEALKAKFLNESLVPIEVSGKEQGLAGDGGIANPNAVSYPITFDQRQPGQLMKSLDSVERSALWCQSLVSTFVQSAKQAYPDVSLEGTSAASLVRTLFNEFPFDGDERSWITVDLNQDFQIPARRDLFYLVLCTLTKNALIAMTNAKTQRPQLKIILGFEKERDDRPAFHTIRFIDNGPGIPEELLSKISYQPLTTRSEQGGSGMGLVFCRRVLQSVSGEVHISSPPETGEPAGTCIALYIRSN